MDSWMYISGITVLVVWMLDLNVEKILPAPQKNKEWWWKHVVTAQMFTCVGGIGSLYCLYENPEMLEDPVNSFSPASYNLVAIALGYFIFDLVDVYLFGPRWLLVSSFPHHVSIITVFVTAFVKQKYICLSIVALLTEVYGIFFFFDRILRAVGAKERGKFYRMNTILVIGTLIIRQFITFWVQYFVSRLWKRIPTVDFLVGLGASTFVTYFNVALFKKAWRSIVRAWAN